MKSFMKSKRRDFIKVIGTGAVAAGTLAVSGGLAEAQETIRPTRPLVSTKVLKHTTRTIGVWTETVASIEVIGSNGAREVTDVIRRATKTSRMTTLVSSVYENDESITPLSTETKTIFVDLGAIGDDGKQDVEVTVNDHRGLGTPRVARIKVTGQTTIDTSGDPQTIVDSVFKAKGLKD